MPHKQCFGNETFPGWISRMFWSLALTNTLFAHSNKVFTLSGVRVWPIFRQTFLLGGTLAPNPFSYNLTNPHTSLSRVCGATICRCVSSQDVDVGTILRGILTCVRRHSVRVDVEYATLILNILCLDSMGKVSEWRSGLYL